MSPTRYRILGAAIVVLALALRVQRLGVRPYHHDEAIHGYDSYRIALATSVDRHEQDFYDYSAVYHGPLLYYLTGAAFAVFGDSDEVGRMVPVTFGMFVVAGLLAFAPELGRGASLLAAFFVAISPVQVYFARFLRHDAFIEAETLFFYALVYRGVTTRRWFPGLLGIASLALAFATMENGYIVALVFAASLVAMGAFKVLYCLGGPMAIARMRGASRLRLLLGHASDVMMAWPGMTQGLLVLFGFATFNLTAALFKDRPPVARALAAAGVGAAAGIVSLWLLYRWLVRSTEPELAVYRRAFLGPALGVAVFGAIFAIAYTNAFRFPERLGSGLFGSLEYWSGQQQKPRLDGPFLYYTSVLLLHEPVTFLYPIGFALARAARATRAIVVASGAAALGIFVVGGKTAATSVAMELCRGVTFGRNPVDVWVVASMGLLFAARAYQELTAGRVPCCFTWLWCFGTFTIYGWAREKVPWLTVHQALPFALLTAMLLSRARPAWRVTVVAAIVLLSAHARWLTLKDGEVNAADPIVYVQTIPEARVAVARAEESLARGSGLILQSEITVPFYWYFRRHVTSYPKTIDAVAPSTVYLTGAGYEGALATSELHARKVSYYAWSVPVWGEAGMGLDGIAAICDWLPGYLLHRDQTPWRRGEFRAVLFLPRAPSPQ
ncbi:MAG: TIGR03663 family protein [Acidobacteriota bacterium]